MQIQTTTRYHHTPIKIAKIKNLIIANAGEDVEKPEHANISYKGEHKLPI